jgi:alkaline phosphatase D
MKQSTTTISAALLALLVGCSAQEPEVSRDTAPEAVAETVSDHPAISRIAFGSCAFQWVEQPIFRAVVAAKPDLYLSLGDAIYGDFDGESTFDVTPESLREEWQELAENPDWQHLVANVPVMATWDNHDYGKAEGGAEFALKEESQQIFLDFFGEPADSERRRSGGVYQAATFGPPGRTVQIVLLDTRYFKGPFVLAERPEGAGGSLGKFAPNEDPAVTLLGDEQWSWLEQQLRRQADIRFIASSTQIVPDQKGMDEWGNYPHERQRLFDLIESTGAEGVVLLTGNVHFSELSKTDEGPYPLYDFTSSGLTHVNDEYPQAPNDYRVAGPHVDLGFGLIEIDWKAGPAPLITFRVIDVDGSVQLEHQVHLGELRSDQETSNG